MGLLEYNINEHKHNMYTINVSLKKRMLVLILYLNNHMNKYNKDFKFIAC